MIQFLMMIIKPIAVLSAKAMNELESFFITGFSKRIESKLTSTGIMPKVTGIFFGIGDFRVGFGDYTIKPEYVDGHVLVVGGVGSGKSSCIAIPTLLYWSNSVFAIDIKGELYEKTKEHRPNIKVFNPLEEDSFGYDPYFCLYTSDNPAQEAKAIAQAIIPLPPDVREPFWIENAQNILTASILHYSSENLSFLETIQKILDVSPKELINELSSSYTQDVRYYTTVFISMDDKTLSSIMAELNKNIVPFVTDKSLISAFSRSDNITPDDLEFGNDVYIKIPEHLLRQWKNLLTLMVNQFLSHFEKRNEADARPILFLLDEFPRLGKISTMLDGLATLRSKKITICLVIQSLAQLDSIYGEKERKVIADTCSYKAVLGASDADSQEYFSRLAGTYEKTMISQGKNSMQMGSSTNTSEMEKRLIKPEEFGMLNEIILFKPFSNPYRIKESAEEIRQKKMIMSMSIFSSSMYIAPIVQAPIQRVQKVRYDLIGTIPLITQDEIMKQVQKIRNRSKKITIGFVVVYFVIICLAVIYKVFSG